MQYGGHKPEVNREQLISWLLYNIAQNSNGYTYDFRVQLTNKNGGNVVRPKGKKLEVVNP